MASLNFEAVSKMHAGRTLRLAIEIRVVVDSVTYWCDINKPIGLGVVPSMGIDDPGVLRLLTSPSITKSLAKSSGMFATQPLTLTLRNDDGFFNHTKGVYLLDSTGTERFLPALRRAWVRLRLIDERTGDAFGLGALGGWYIDKINRPNTGTAQIVMQPLERLLQTAKPDTVKGGDWWYQGQHVGFLVRRLVNAGIPGVEFESGSPPGVVYKDVRPDHVPTTIYSGVMDDRGRQPEISSLGEPTFNESMIPTAICPSLTAGKFFYAVANQEGKADIYEYTIATHVSRLVYPSALEDMPCAWLHQPDATYILVGLTGNKFPDRMSNTVNRQSHCRKVKISDGTSTLIMNNVSTWPCCDAFVASATYAGGQEGIGWSDITEGHKSGEMMGIPFPQAVATVHGVDLSYAPSRNTAKVPRSDPTVTSLIGEYGDAFRYYDRGGFSQQMRAASSYLGWWHLGAMPFPFHWVERKQWIVSIYYDWASSFEFWLRRYDYANSTLLVDRKIDFPDLSPNQPLRQYQITGAVVVSATSDPTLGTVNHLYIATTHFRMTGKGDSVNTNISTFWRIDLDVESTLGYTVANGGLLSKATGAVSAIYTSLAYFPNTVAGAGGIICDAWDGTTGLHKCAFCTLGASPAVATFYPQSGSPFVGHVAIGSAGASSAVVFRDTGTGALWMARGAALKFEVIGDGAPVGDETWEACPRLCVLPDASPYLSQIVGFTAPTSPMWVRPWDALEVPKPSPIGGYRLWILSRQLSVRVPIADFSEYKSVSAALEGLAQLCGPTWRFGFNSNLQFYFKEFPDRVHDCTIVPASDRTADPSSIEVPVFAMRFEDVTAEDVQNSVVFVPYRVGNAPVNVTVELGPRAGATEFHANLSVTARVRAPRRVVLTVAKDGLVGGVDDIALYNSGYWESHLLLEAIETPSDILTELAAISTTYATVRVVGLSKTEHSTHRSIGGSIVRAATATFGGDWIQIGESAWGRITGFADPDTITTSLSSSSVPIPKGTSVRIQSASSRGFNAAGNQTEQLTVFADTIGGTVNDKTLYVGNADGVHVGDVVQYDFEYMLVTDKNPIDQQYNGYTHALTVTRGYLLTTRVVHNTAKNIRVFLHPRDFNTHLIGATGLAVAFDYDPLSHPNTRSLQSGDRIILDYDGAKAEESSFSFGTADGQASITLFGKRTNTIDDNRFVGIRFAAHCAYEWKEFTQWPRIPAVVEMPLCPEITEEFILRLVSARELPDETNNEKKFWPISISHNLSRNVTTFQLLSTQPAAVEDGSGFAGIGQGVGDTGGV